MEDAAPVQAGLQSRCHVTMVHNCAKRPWRHYLVVHLFCWAASYFPEASRTGPEQHMALHAVFMIRRAFEALHHLIELAQVLALNLYARCF